MYMIREKFIHYTLDHKDLDEQHWELFVMLDEICATLRNKDIATANMLLDNLIVFVTAHSAFEDELMTSIDYPYAKWHNNNVHVDTIKLLKNRLPHLSHYDIAAFETAFVYHVDHCDRQLTEWINSQPT